MKKIFPIPKNPNHDKVYRKRDILERTSYILGGCSVIATSLYLKSNLDTSDVRNEWLSLPVLVAGFTVACAVAIEIEERYRWGGNSGGGGWKPDDFPLVPNDPRGLTNDWIAQVESFSNTHEPILT
jgi:hypothetical protein